MKPSAPPLARPPPEAYTPAPGYPVAYNPYDARAPPTATFVTVLPAPPTVVAHRPGGDDDDPHHRPFAGYAHAASFAPAFAEAAVRRVFVRKVFTLVAAMLLFTLAVSSAFLFVPSVNLWVVRNPWLTWVAFLGMFGAMLVLTCSPTLRLRSPHDVVLLAAFTVFVAFFVGVVSSFYSARAVALAVGIVSVLVFALALFAAQTRVDFTTMRAMLVALLLGLILMGVLSIWFYSEFLMVVYATLGAVLFSAYLVMDPQSIMGGKTYALGPEEHVLAAVVVFLDVVNLFLFILRLVGFGSRD